MSENKKKKGLIEKLTYKYRLLVINENTFEQRASLRLSRMNIYAVLSGLFLVVAFVVFALIAYTPVKYYLPGMEFTDNRGQLMALQYRTDSLAKALETQEIWISKYRSILDNDLDSSFYDAGSRELTNRDSVNIGQMSESERDLRQRMEKQEMFALRSNNGSAEDWSLLALQNPVEGLIIADFDNQNKHYGIDIAAPAQSPVMAVQDGVVLSSDWNMETGYSIVIQHADNLVSFYRHNASILKKTGERVRAGEAIALLGNTGELSTGPHLHLEVWKGGQPIDPQKLLTLETVE